MARYTHVDYGQMRLVPVRFAHRILPGRFAYARSYLIDQELVLSAFEGRLRNDDVGAPAYSPAVLLKMVLLAYRKGLVSSRALEAACRENVLCMAISGDSQPHVTTLSAANLAERERRSIDASIPDAGYRTRDPRLAGSQRHRDNPAPLYGKTPQPDTPRLFSAQAFRPAEDLSHGLCPAGKRRYRDGRHHDLNGFEAVKFTGTKRDGMGCSLRPQCLRHPQSSAVQQVAILLGRAPGRPESPSERMRRKTDGERGRELMGRRSATSEPVCGNLRHNERLHRCTRRGRVKVDGQWQRCGLVHHIEQVAHHGDGQ
jgi:Transposase DDE domain/Transposase domain (DUF772)